MVTDQTSAHDPLNGYLPKGWSWEEYRQRAQTEPAKVVAAAKQSMADHVKAMLAFQQMGVPTFDYGNNIRQMAKKPASTTPSTSGLRAGLHPSAVLPRYRAVPLGGAVRRSAGHLQNRRHGERADPG